jgi:hypothetical protein
VVGTFLIGAAITLGYFARVTAPTNPALSAFLEALVEGLVFGLVEVCRKGNDFELRHHRDACEPDTALRAVQCNELPVLAQCTESGQFRPLKSAPNLRQGWRLVVASPRELERALETLHPGGLADWFAARSSKPPVTNYREFMGRQTGMYRITQRLTDAQAGGVIRATCAARFCVKRRLWSVDGLDPDPAGAKSLVPCLEPCALLLEVARRAMRTEQESKIDVPLASSEIASVVAGLEAAICQTASWQREADFADPANPRRLQLIVEKLRPLLPATLVDDAE